MKYYLRTAIYRYKLRFDIISGDLEEDKKSITETHNAYAIKYFELKEVKVK